MLSSGSGFYRYSIVPKPDIFIKPILDRCDIAYLRNNIRLFIFQIVTIDRFILTASFIASIMLDGLAMPLQAIS